MDLYETDVEFMCNININNISNNHMSVVFFVFSLIL